MAGKGKKSFLYIGKYCKTKIRSGKFVLDITVFYSNAYIDENSF